MPTTEQRADLFTKTHHGDIFWRFDEAIMHVRNIDSWFRRFKSVIAVLGKMRIIVAIV